MTSPHRFPATLRLTPLQKRFVSSVARGVDSEKAAREAGYAREDAANAAFELLHTENVETALIIEMGRLMRTVMAPMAIKVGKSMLENERTSERVREGLIKTFLDRTGFPADRPHIQDRTGDKALHEMSGEDLRRYISRLEGEQSKIHNELATRAKPVITLPSVPAWSSEASDMFD